MHRFVLPAVVAFLFAATAPGQTVLLISNELGNRIDTLNTATLVVGNYHTGINNPDGIQFAPDGTLFVTSFTGGTLNRITSPTTFVQVAGGFNGAAGIDRDAAGNIYVTNFGNPSGGGTNISRVAPDGTVTLNFATGLSTPDTVVFDNSRTFLYVSEWGGNRIRRIDPATGAVSPFVTEAAGLNQPASMAFDSAGNLYVTNWGNGTVSRVTPGGVVTNNYATGIPNSFGLLLDEPNGFFYATSWTGGYVTRFPFAGGQAEIIATGFEGPTFLAIQPVPEPGGMFVMSGVAATALAVRRRLRR